MNADSRWEEAVALTHGAQMRKSVTTRAGDKVQVMSAVCDAVEQAYVKPIVQGFAVPTLAKNARAGHPTFQNGKEAHGETLGHAPNSDISNR